MTDHTNKTNSESDSAPAMTDTADKSWKRLRKDIEHAIYSRDNGRCHYCQQELMPFGSKFAVSTELLVLRHIFHSLPGYAPRALRPGELQQVTGAAALQYDLAVWSQHTRQTVRETPEFARMVAAKERDSTVMGSAFYENPWHRPTGREAQDDYNEANRALIQQCEQRWQEFCTAHPLCERLRVLERERYDYVGRLPSIDHVVPHVRGGTDALDNLVLACRRCNSRKNDKLRLKRETRQFWFLREGAWPPFQRFVREPV